ncbi:MAG TPA: diguanylate cyclase [Bacteroidales bacterium]|nr:diguanylate cyclase [Bacteroidales bacterium]
MKILIVDDDAAFRIVLKAFLQWAGYTDFIMTTSPHEALYLLKKMDQDENQSPVDLILMDITMPGINGIETTRLIRQNSDLDDIPIIMVTASDAEETLAEAFEAGAVDYIKKPLNKIELRARVRSALRLKQETDQRKAREQELFEANRLLQEANRKLERLSFQDGLTRIPNRRYFDKFLKTEWLDAVQQKRQIALIMMDIDYFKLYNDSYGHLSGDECLKKVANVLDEKLTQSTDLVARYGGEEFVALLADTDKDTVLKISESMRSGVADLGIVHELSECCDVITISVGFAVMVPQTNKSPALLIEAADKALYRAKHEGRNRICIYENDV